mmetsp:Transcript_19055/g.43381  ORF Transcript_19055/g.43381 Transcript_19055/m.43381 type:complete len:333 (-) Transcript_19055:289-1287(-)|eukprot:CAMPEP_0113304402 /NCGR_PEP_ID=MMETSP0010_2-20120614/4441_1 /TAXON_ID=216773 ORGANISM="Corethron hystrix, Strain 308" /NCGR_SAMPLE_ID=MMETSP0010_2 /ASSEMBLY_ACC=CAM_ASM_000155 /LENGTH=332 /DNA_ID=CAMNT_0000158609 /DNA_START=159 /DNA_END=1157 /DNA_ORIENTATION=- /assembly_acc=CAM_ASM_000155
MAMVMEDGSVEMEIDSFKRFNEVYDISSQELLGKGGFSSVVVGYHLYSGVAYAVKVTDTSRMNLKSISRLHYEFSIQRELNHENLVKTYAYFDEPPKNYIVMEYLKGGELFDRIVKKQYYNEADARRLCKILLCAVGHMHRHNIAHRDLKPENIFLLNEDDDTSIKIGDFGFAKRVAKPKSLSTSCGTLSYMAPELIRRQLYDERADIWSIGVILYILLGGYSPFNDQIPDKELAREIVSGKVIFHKEYWRGVSNEAIDLIRSLLTVDMDSRPNAKWALLHPWIASISDFHLSSRDLSGSLINLKSFNARRKLKGAMVCVLSAVNFKNKLKV